MPSHFSETGNDDAMSESLKHLQHRAKLLRVVRLSDQAYTVDALAVRGDEGRANLRKASVR